MKAPGHKFHPARVPGHVKFGRALEVNKKSAEEKKKEDKLKMKPLDLSKSNWSLSTK